MNSPVSPGHPSGEQTLPTHYTPGAARRKWLMIGIGLLAMAAGVSQMWLPLKLLAVGGRATAEATRVIKARPGTPDLTLTSDVEVHASQETRDRTSTFWNEFRFQDAGGRDVVVRCPVGSQLKPLFELIDEDGLPTTLPVHYLPANPEQVSFPTVFSTWFAPGLLTLVGLGVVAAGAVLLYWSGKPIEMPHVG